MATRELTTYFAQ